MGAVELNSFLFREVEGWTRLQEKRGDNFNYVAADILARSRKLDLVNAWPRGPPGLGWCGLHLVKNEVTNSAD
jgi:hypothetical protein